MSLAKAFFTIKGDEAHPIPVDFNPVTLQVTVQTQAESAGGDKVQTVSKSSAKLDLELVFDSTGSGEDVRNRTRRIEGMLAPGENIAPPSVIFEWGAFSFEGVVDSFKQTLDFFSENGVPLRSVVTLSIGQTKYVFDPNNSTKSAKVDDTLDLDGGTPFGLATAAGDAGAARLIAAANGLESLRAEAGAGISVGGGITIGAAAGFGAGVGAGAGGAFAGLQLGGGAGVGGGASFDVGKVLAATAPPAISAGAKFDVSGKASLTSGSSFKADVSGGVRFDD